MPRSHTTLRVLVAYPDDVVEERGVLEEVIDEYNRLDRDLNLRLELIAWDRDVTPGVGPDPQTVINDQIGEDYDIFIGILWTRFGSPTPRAPSGTKEEFDRAYERFSQSPDDLRIMFYFCDRPVNPADLDTTQLQLTQAFRRELADKAIYATYTTIEEFRNLVRLHLTRQAREWGKTWGRNPLQPAESTTKAPRTTVAAAHPPTPGDDEGLLDLIEQGNEAMEEATRIVGRIGESIERLGNSLSARGTELKAVSSSKDMRLTRRFLDRAASDLLTFADAVDEEIPLFAQAYGRALDAFGRSAVLLPELNPSDTKPIEQARDTIRTIIDAIQSGKSSVEGLRQSVNSLPPISTSMNRAKNRAVSTLDGLTAEWSRAVDGSKEVEALYELALEEVGKAPP